MSAENWTEDDVLHLIEVYKNYSILWDPKDPNYFKKLMKEDAWQEIGKLLNRSEENCKTKMLSLLSSNKREKVKERKSKGT